MPHLFGSIDATKVHIEPRRHKGAKPEGPEEQRDMKVLCWFQAERVPPAQCSSRQRQKVEREQIPLRAKQIHYFCDILEADQFGKLLWASGCTVNADLSPKLVFLGDEAPWIWNLVTHYYPNAVQIVDFSNMKMHYGY